MSWAKIIPGLRDWIARRPATIAISIFFVIWFGLQLTVMHILGEEVARWWFYAEHNYRFPPEFQPGFLVSPISHDFHDPMHLLGNFGLLLFAGGLIEPFIGKKKVFVIAIGISYLGTFLANATVFLHDSWTYAGPSVGIFALLSYASLRLVQIVRPFSIPRDTWWGFVKSWSASTIAVIVLVAIGYEIFINWNVGHIAGFLLGYVYFGTEWWENR